VIPFVVGQLSRPPTGDEIPITPPERCPVCGFPVLHPEGERLLLLQQSALPRTGRPSLEYFVSRGAMDIEGLGEKGVRQLLQAGLIKDEADLFTLKAEDLANLEGYADLRIQNLLKNAEGAKDRPLIGW